MTASGALALVDCFEMIDCLAENAFYIYFFKIELYKLFANMRQLAPSAVHGGCNATNGREWSAFSLAWINSAVDGSHESMQHVNRCNT